MRPDISFIGAGNVAFRFSLALQERGYRVPHIYSRTEKSLERLVKALRVNGCDTEPACRLSDMLSDSLIFIAVSDDAIAEVVSALAEALADTGMRPSVVHTSGATDISVLKPLADMGCRCGVVYPLMTLSRNKNVEFKDVPLLLEAMSEDLAPVIDSIASDLGGEHYFYTSEQRLKMHVAAVFTTNFVNYLLGLAFPIVQHDHPLLIPGTIEAVRNAFLHTPASTLTGPARRGDTATIQKHLDILDKLGLKEQEEIYRLFTDKILKKYHHDK